jgi:hypothetical protein
MASLHESPEYRAIQKHYTDLTIAVVQGNIPGALFQNDVIDDETLEVANSQTKTSREKGATVMKKIRETLRMDPPKTFTRVCDALGMEASVADLLKQLKGTYVKERTSMVLETKPCERVEYIQAKCELQVLQKAFYSTSSSEAKDSAVTLLKDRIQQFIEISLQAGLVVDKVKSEINALCHKEAAVPSILWEWVKDVFDEKSHKRVEQKPDPKASTCVEKLDEEPVLFCKDTVYHAGLCCEAVSSCPSEKDARIFFQQKSPRHNFDAVSLSTDDHVKPYLIAKQENTIYVAFRSEALLSNWKGRGYSEDLKYQASQIPVRFFTELLWSNHRVVLTGFSFGGMLACCIMANLWQESRISAEVLLKRATCIMFGQPFMKIQLVDQVFKMCPDLKKSIHSVFLKEDIFPQIMGYASLTAATQHGKQREKSPQVPDEARQGDTSTMLASAKRVRVMSDSLIKLQEVLLQKNKSYSEAASPTLQPQQAISKAVEALKDEIMKVPESPEDIVRLVYGACYVMSIDPEAPDQGQGISWHQAMETTPKILALQLTFSKNALVKKIDGSLFKKHIMEHYNQMILRSYLDIPESYAIPNAHSSVQMHMKMLLPSVKRIEVHEYPKEHVLLVEGDNLWFAFKITLDEGGPHQCEVGNPHNITKCSLQFNFSPSHKVSSAIEDGKKVKVTLHTHFMMKVQDAVESKKEPYSLSVRQIQLAKHTPSQVIKLAYLCALLEQQQGTANQTKRYLKITCFLEEAVKVVPVESVLNAIAYARHDLALDCAKALKQSKLTLQPTQLMRLGLYHALFRAIFGIPVLNNLETGGPMHAIASFIQVLGAAVVGPEIPVSQPQYRHTVRSKSQASPVTRAAPPTRTPTMNYADVVSGRSSAEVQSSLKGTQSAVQRQRPQHLSQEQDQYRVHQFMAIQRGPFPHFMHDPTSPDNIVFPKEIATYLRSCWDDLAERAEHLVRSGKSLDVVGKTNLEEIYPTSATLRRNLFFDSPRVVLAQSIEKLSNFIKEPDMEVNLAKPPKHHSNKEMLKLLNEIYNYDVALCVALLGSFMEQHIRIPFLQSPEVTAKALSSPIAVGVWALFSVSREHLQEMLRSSKNDELVVEVREYIHNVLTEQTQENEDSEEQMYAGKLQFLLQGMHRTVTSSTKYISYSLEYQLCNNLKFKRDISVQDLLSKWDKIFKDDVLSLVAESHRPLLARWLKWTVLVHDLREVLAEYTCIGVTGLINSGKSLLVKKLFNIKKVQVGTLKSKHTTVPLLYNLDFDNLDVIDFPGLDDNDESVPELAQLMLTLSQIIIFVVDYRRISAHAIKVWLDKIKTDDVPVLVCLTHADNLYLECVGREDEYNTKKVEFKKQAIGIELMHIQDKIGRRHSWKVDFFSFSQVPTVTRDNLKAVGIKSHVDVGEWIVETLRHKLDQTDLADKLCSFFSPQSSPC